jgi:peptide/nickel transport system substrate-binding protein
MRKGCFLFVFYLACLFIGSLSEAQQNKESELQSLTFAGGTEILTLDPQFTTHAHTANVTMHIHETLVKYDMDMNLIPSLAESWAVSENGLIWTFRLRRGIRFHDGTAFNAEAVKYSFDRLLDFSNGSPRRDALSMVKETKVVSPYAIEFILRKPFAPFLNQLTVYNLAILSPKAAKKWGREYSIAPAGTGPFKLESWSSGEKVVLSRNDRYWDWKPHFDKLIFRVIPDDATRVKLLLKGEVDVISPVPVALISQFDPSKVVRVIEEKGLRTIYLGFNNKMKPFDDLRVRKAVSHSINTEAILKNVLKGKGSIGGGHESPFVPGAHQGLKPYPYDPALAKKLLAEAGYPKGFSTTLFAPKGRYFMDEEVARAIQAQLKEVGIIAQIETPDWPTYIRLLEKGTEIPMFIMGKGSPSADLNFTLNHGIKTGGKMNYSQYSSPKVDRLIAEQEGIVDPRRRFQVLYEIQTIIYNEVPNITLFYEDQILGKRRNIHGIEIYPFEFINFSRAFRAE